MLNEMMHRPIINPDILNYLRENQRQLDGKLADLENYAHEKGVPVIPHETVVFLKFLLQQKQPKDILEIGTAIGFSASLMAETVPEAKVTTIDRFEIMINQAKETFEKMNLTDRVTLLEGDAADVLKTLDGPYDFIFMDSAKAKYITFLPECLHLLSDTGILMVDDIFQAGTVLQPIEEIPRKNRSIHRHLNEFLKEVNESPELNATLLPLGDGVALISKNIAK